jgi:ATP-binding cassette, subfamily B, multidrug efflux pump
MSTELRRSDWSMFKDLLPFLRPDAWLYGFALLLAPLSASMVIVQPMMLQQAIDNTIATRDIDGLAAAAGIYLGAVLIAFLAETGYSLSASYGAMRSIARIRSTVYAHTLSLTSSFFDTQPTGRLLTRATSDVDALGETLTAGAFTIVLDVLLVVGIALAMFTMDAKLTLTLLLVGPPLALFVELLRRVLRRLYLLVRTNLSVLNSYMAEQFIGVQVVQLYSNEARSLKAFDERNHAYRNATVRTNIWDALLYAIIDGTSSICMALMFWYGSGGFLEGTLTAGLLAAFIDYVAKLFRPIQEFSQKVATIQRASSALEKIFGLLDVDERISGDQPIPNEVSGHLVFSDVHFSYTAGNDILRGVDLELAPGEVVALVGRTGSGKTTIGKLLVRAYGGYRGHITLDGMELSRLAPSAVRRVIGMVRQDVQLFPGDVRFNLTLGGDIPDDALHAAIKAAHAGAVVERLGGLDGRIAHRGANVSAGEAQLLSFARTLAHDPPIVILDEATANVDSLTEAAIQGATEAILSTKTVLVVAHRLSTITNADRIVLLDAGSVVESGSHTQLLASGGAYARLFREQFEPATGGGNTANPLLRFNRMQGEE